MKHFDEDTDFERCGTCDNCTRMSAVVEPMPAAATVAPQNEVAPKVPEAPPFAAGDEVSVRRYGNGIVVAADALHVTVRFPSGDERSFLASFVAERSARKAR